MPIFNVESYLCRCIDSVLSQTLSDIEIILATDGPDSCDKICHEYEKKDSRIKVVFHPGSYGKAFNKSVEIAQGEYVGIVETDDWCDKSMFEKMYNRACCTNADVVKCGFYYAFNDVTRNYSVIYDQYPEEFSVFEYPDFLASQPSVWSCIYKKEFLINNNISMIEERQSFIDVPFHYETLYKANKYILLKEPLYYYYNDNQNQSVQHVNVFDGLKSEKYSYSQVFKNKEIYNKLREGFVYSSIVHLRWNFDHFKTDKQKKVFWPIAHEYVRSLDSVGISFCFFSPELKSFYEQLKKYSKFSKRIMENNRNRRMSLKKIYAKGVRFIFRPLLNGIVRDVTENMNRRIDFLNEKIEHNAKNVVNLQNTFSDAFSKINIIDLRQKTIESKVWNICEDQKISLDNSTKILGIAEELGEKTGAINIPSSVFEYMTSKNLSFSDALYDLRWRNEGLPFGDLNRSWQLHLLTNRTLDYWLIFEHYIYFLYEHGDLLNNMRTELKKRSYLFWRWTQKTQLYSLSFLIKNNEYDFAKKYLQFYIAQHGEQGLEELLPVAWFAKNNGVHAEAVEIAADKYALYLKNAYVFENLVKGKKVALIGNGPQEKGVGHGVLIDSYDTVIRFNTYNINEEFKKDYGSKVTLWANCGDLTKDDFSAKGNFEWFLFLPDLFLESPDARCFDDFSKIIPVDIGGARKYIYDKTGLYCASSGFMLIAAIKQINSRFSADDCFGFSFKTYDPEKNKGWTHYYEKEIFSAVHSLELEASATFKVLS